MNCPFKSDHIIESVKQICKRIVQIVFVNQIRLFIKKNNSNELFIYKLEIISS